MDNSSGKVEIEKNGDNSTNIFNNTKTESLISNENLDNTQKITNKTSTKNPSIKYNDTEFNNNNYNKTTSKNESINIQNTKPNMVNNIEIKLDNNENNFLLYIEIAIPIFLIFIIILIYYFVKKKKKSKLNTSQNDSLDQNKIQENNFGNKQPYNKLQNTSGLNNNLGLNQNNLSEIKVQNMKEEINNIINSSGSSSGRRRREKKKSTNNNIMGFEGKEGQIGMQNEIKEQIKQYVIDEHNNNS